mgnify:CR=1 FL=1
MPLTIDSAAGSLALDAGSRLVLERRLGEALQRARATGGAVLAAVTLRADPATDPAAVAAASRRPGEPWFAM